MDTGILTDNQGKICYLPGGRVWEKTVPEVLS